MNSDGCSREQFKGPHGLAVRSVPDGRGVLRGATAAPHFGSRYIRGKVRWMDFFLVARLIHFFVWARHVCT